MTYVRISHGMVVISEKPNGRVWMWRYTNEELADEPTPREMLHGTQRNVRWMKFGKQPPRMPRNGEEE